MGFEGLEMNKPSLTIYQECCCFTTIYCLPDDQLEKWPEGKQVWKGGVLPPKNAIGAHSQAPKLSPDIKAAVRDHLFLPHPTYSPDPLVTGMESFSVSSPSFTYNLLIVCD